MQNIKLYPPEKRRPADISLNLKCYNKESRGSQGFAMSVITISRQLGSLGCEIAQAAGARLGYRVVWRDLINQAARRAGVPGVALSTIDELGLLGVRSTPEEQTAYTRALNQIMEELAREGSVIIVGRAGQAILRGWDNTFHIRIVAPADLRARRIMKAQQITFEAAQAQIQASDKARKIFLQRNYRINWESLEYYDLVINTAQITIQSAAGLICNLVSPLNINTANPPLTSK
jgi:cytidylate kinase